jgi:hypothetical protein
MARPRHPDKDIEAAVSYAESCGWVCTISKRGHAWGRLRCPYGQRGGCQFSVWSTPIRREVARCPH